MSCFSLTLKSGQGWGPAVPSSEWCVWLWGPNAAAQHSAWWWGRGWVSHPQLLCVEEGVSDGVCAPNNKAKNKPENQVHSW